MALSPAADVSLHAGHRVGAPYSGGQCPTLASRRLILQSDEVIQLREALAAAQRQNEVLSTSVALSEAAATTDDLTALARHVGAVMRRNIPNLLAAYFTRQDERWVAEVDSDAVPPEFMALLRAGLPLGTPFLAQTVTARTPQFFDHWNAAEQGMPQAAQFQAVGVAPFFQGEQAVSLLTVGPGGSGGVD